MSEFGSVTSALLGQVSKLVRTLSDEEMKLLATGEIKLSLVGPGHRVIEKSAALDRALKFVEGLPDDDLGRLEDKQASLALIGPEHRVIEKSPALDRALKFVEGLPNDDVRRLEDRQASLALLRKGDKVVSALDLRDIADQAAAQPSEADVIRILSDSRLTAANLKKVAEELKVAVPPDVKARTALQLYIAEKVASSRGLPA